VRLSHVLPLRKGDLETLLAHPRRGVTEKVNGRRCVIVGEEDGTLRAFNRTGGEVAVPAAALALARLGGSFIIDGEAMERDQAGAFYAFDYLARHGASLRSLPYEERITRLTADLLGAGLIDQAGPTVTRMVSTVPGLGLLFPAMTEAEKRAVLAEVEAAGGEGVIFRDLDGPSIPGDTRYEQKWKLKGELDVAVLEHQLRGGMVAGTFLIGVRREADGAWIALGNANTGLSRAQFAAVKAAVEAGQPVVLRIEFLSGRTIGISPVEPVVVEIRTDKPATDCGAAQLVAALGEDRAALIAAAPAWTPRARAA
jgi:ATP-dependent DNA ligase